MRIVARVFVVLFCLVATGCSTVGYFNIPANTVLYVEEQQAEVGPDGAVRTRPFFWNAAPGVHYRLEKDGATIQRGRVPSQFRPVSIFWPPYALIYWPMGFRQDLTFDLINGTNVTVTHGAAKPAPASGR